MSQAGRADPNVIRMVVDTLRLQGLEDISFLDYLVYLPMFANAHDEVVSNPFRMSIAPNFWDGGATTSRGATPAAGVGGGGTAGGDTRGKRGLSKGHEPAHAGVQELLSQGRNDTIIDEVEGSSERIEAGI
jgi:hypothetical protein